MTAQFTHLDLLESESIHIFREAAAQFRKPVLLYSIGKDSTVLLHLARKAFWPGKLQFPILHVNTTWKFKEMIAFRDHWVKEFNLDLIEMTNHDAIAKGVNPYDYAPSIYTDIMKTVPLKAGLDSTVHSHLIAFAAEEARVTGRTVDVEEFSRREPGP